MAVRERLLATCILSLAREGSWAKTCWQPPSHCSSSQRACAPLPGAASSGPPWKGVHWGRLLPTTDLSRLRAGPTTDKKLLHPVLARSKSEGRGPAPAEPQSHAGGVGWEAGTEEHAASTSTWSSSSSAFLSRSAMFLRRPAAPTGSADEE